MAIIADSSQWTGESDEGTKPVRVVWGEFADEAARDAAMRKLNDLGAERQHDLATKPEAPLDKPDENPEGADQRNQRALHVGVAMSATALAAAGLVIASGGALLPAVADAAAAGAGTGIAGEAVANAVAPEPGPTTPPPAPSGPIIGLRAPDEARQHGAETLLRELGAHTVTVREGSETTDSALDRPGTSAG